MKKYYVYAFLDMKKPGNFTYLGVEFVFDYEPFYIGKGNQGRINTSICRGSQFKMNKIRKVSPKNVKIIKLFEDIENREALDIEIDLISKIGRRDLSKGPLVNLTDGGDGRLESPHSEEVKMKISRTKKMQGLSIPHTDETKEILRIKNLGEKNPMFGKQHTEEVKEKHSLRVSGINHPMFGKKHTEDTIKKIKTGRSQSVDQEKSNRISKEFNSKSVIQLTLDGEFIKEYESIKVASIETGLSESIIGKTCRGVIKKPGSFLFRFKNDKDKVLRNSFKIKVGDFVTINGISYKLLKRNYRSFVVDSDGTLTSFRRKEYEFIWKKNEV